MGTMGPSWDILLFFAGLLSAWSLVIIGTTRWVINKGLSQYDERILALAKCAEDMEKAIKTREREILELRADLPLQYVRREDAIRQETVINAKLDMLSAKIDNLRKERAGGTQ